MLVRRFRGFRDGSRRENPVVTGTGALLFSSDKHKRRKQYYDKQVLLQELSVASLSVIPRLDSVAASN
jgi:ribonuclease HI